MSNQNFPFKQWDIQFSLSLFSSFFPFQMHFPSDLQSTKNAFPFRPPTNQTNKPSKLSNQTAAVNPTRAHNSSSTQQPRERYTAILRHTAVLPGSSFPCCNSPLQQIYSPLKLIYLAALLSSAVDLLPFAVGLPRSSPPPLGNRPALLAT